MAYHDPYVPSLRVEADPTPVIIPAFESLPLDGDTFKEADCVAILVGHQGVHYHQAVTEAALVIDTVGATRGLSDVDGKVVMLGVGKSRVAHSESD